MPILNKIVGFLKFYMFDTSQDTCVHRNRQAYYFITEYKTWIFQSLSALIQIVAASLAKRQVCYITFGDQKLCDDVNKIVSIFKEDYALSEFSITIFAMILFLEMILHYVTLLSYLECYLIMV